MIILHPLLQSYRCGPDPRSSRYSEFLHAGGGDRQERKAWRNLPWATFPRCVTFSDVRDIVRLPYAPANPSPRVVFNVGSGVAYKIGDLLHSFALRRCPSAVEIDPENSGPSIIRTMSVTIRAYANSERNGSAPTIRRIFNHYRDRLMKLAVERPYGQQIRNRDLHSAVPFA